MLRNYLRATGKDRMALNLLIYRYKTLSNITTDLSRCGMGLGIDPDLLSLTVTEPQADKDSKLGQLHHSERRERACVFCQDPFGERLCRHRGNAQLDGDERTDKCAKCRLRFSIKVALKGQTSIVIAHRLSTVLRADQILVVQDGRIVERGVHADLLASGHLYSELYHRQFSAA
jgi:hypothetical protein